MTLNAGNIGLRATISRPSTKGALTFMAPKGKNRLLINHMSMWPREIFDRDDFIQKKDLDVLAKPGVYVLYRDDEPYYIGQAEKTLRGRISQHATDPTQPRYQLWNFFSAFVIEDSDDRADVEAILIAAMPTANSARPKLPKEQTPKLVRELFKHLRAKRAFAPD